MDFTLSEYLTAQFYAWEKRCRGWNVFENPVHLEPEFIPFIGHFPPESSGKLDDGRRPRFFPELQEALGLYVKESSAFLDDDALEKLNEKYAPCAYSYELSDPLKELQIHFKSDTRIPFDFIEQLLLMIGSGDYITAFEIIGSNEEIVIQFTCPHSHAKILEGHLNIYIPDATIKVSEYYLDEKLDFTESVSTIELGVGQEFMRPLRSWKKYEPDPLAGCISVLEKLQEDEIGVLQVLFQKVINPWSESIKRAVTDSQGQSFFYDDPNMLPLAIEKTSYPLYSVVVRTFGQSSEYTRAREIAANISMSLRTLDRVGSNSLIPLQFSEDETCCDADDVIARRSRRTGMLLNSQELAALVHIPDSSIKAEKLRKYAGKSKKAPKELLSGDITLGFNSHLGQEVAVKLKEEHRLRHMHIIGATGTGKSSIIKNLIVQDILSGNGVTVLDPHGDLIDDIIGHIPENRLQDVILVDPSDIDYPIGLNLLSANNDAEKVILSSDLVSLFKRFATSWGDQMTSVLSNAINAILDSSEGGTLIDLNRFLVEDRFRNKYLQTVNDPTINYYWKQQFKLIRKASISPILTRLDTFLRPRIVRNMMAQKSGLDFADILNSQKVLLVKLSQGQIGEENSYLLGSLFVTKIHQAAQSRQNLKPRDRKATFLYIDEFQNFVTPSMSSILSGARKYGLGLILAHQDLEQVSRKDSELANSVLSNAFTRICFRCGDKDADRLSEGFSSFDSTDIQNLDIGKSIVRVGKKENDFNLNFNLLTKTTEVHELECKNKVQDKCRKLYGKSRESIEEYLQQLYSYRDEGKTSKKPAVDKTETSKNTSKDTTEKPIPPIGHSASTKSKELGISNQKADEFVNRDEQNRELREHQYMQEFIRRVAIERGFEAVVEQEIDGGAGRVDVSLEKDSVKIAVEVSVTTSKEHEFQNIQKCLDAGYNIVISCSRNEKHLRNIEKFCSDGLKKEGLKQTVFLTPEAISVFLDSLFKNETKSEQMERGYRIKVEFADDSEMEIKAKKQSIAQAIIQSKRNKGNKSD